MLTYLKSAYTYKGMARMSYGWENPNYAAAFIACLIPVAWGLTLILFSRKSKVLTVALLSVETVAYIALMLTYSRGALIGLLIGLCFFSFITRNQIEKDFWLSTLAFRISCMAMLFVISGLGSRMTGMLAGDKSALNRIDLWLGGLGVINMRPLTGWGFSNGGLAYMQWLQDPASSLKYRGFVNSYLTCASQYGLIVLGLVLTLCFLPLVLRSSETNYQSRPGRHYMGMALKTCLLVFLGTSIFNTLWHDTPLIVLGAMIVFAGICVQWTNLRRLAGAVRPAAMYSIACIAALYLASLAGAKFHNPSASLRSDGSMVYSCNTNIAKSPDPIVLLPDIGTFGLFYGKVMRSSIQKAPNCSFRIYPHDIPLSSTATFDSIIASGRRIREISAHPGKLLVIVNPTIPPPSWCENVAEKTILILSAHGRDGLNHTWERCAAMNANMHVLSVAAYGNNLTTIWGEILPKVTGLTSNLKI